jgi:hypothetical protein
MPCEVIQAVRNENVLVNVKGRRDSLREHINDVVDGEVFLK